MRFSPFALLVCVAVLCGLAFSFLPWPDSGPGRETARGPDADEAYRIASELVARRDAALRAHDADALSLLTAEGSAARRADLNLLEGLGSIAALETVVMDVEVRSELEWDVRSVQYAFESSDGTVQDGPLPQRCTRWTLERDPWRVSATAPCEG